VAAAAAPAATAADGSPLGRVVGEFESPTSTTRGRSLTCLFAFPEHRPGGLGPCWVRDGIGVGVLEPVGELLDWAGTRAADEGDRWLRVDVWTINERLQHYLEQGFTYVRTVVLPHNASGALFQRPAKRVPTPRLQEVESLTGCAWDGPRAALVAGASFSHRAQGGGIWPGGGGMPDTSRKPLPPTNSAPGPAMAGT
jgi:hypothetical protein